MVQKSDAVKNLQLDGRSERGDTIPDGEEVFQDLKFDDVPGAEKP